FVILSSESVMILLDSFLPGDVSYMIRDNLETLVNNRSGRLISIVNLGTIWSASNVFNAITISFNKAYQVEEDRSCILNRLIALGLMLGLVLVIAVALVGAVFGKVIGEYVFGFIGLDDYVDAWNVIRWVVTTVTLFLVLFIFYILFP